eukprot:TRINITY_DN9525_c0_g1_i1.p1 TRINITY_DN9525_c0_g1~~TRINITY_DN9525_c0_g1_i1.p1  ORF type:complete len:137 (-),score=54.01 TRINITY_DN9525_c0_g1_i1:17-427(-)
MDVEAPNNNNNEIENEIDDVVNNESVLGKRKSSEVNLDWINPKRKCMKNEDEEDDDDDENDFAINLENVFAASKRIESNVIISPCKYSKKLSDLTGSEIYIKKDFVQYSGSFKERGTLNALLKLSKRQKKVCCYCC